MSDAYDDYDDRSGLQKLMDWLKKRKGLILGLIIAAQAYFMYTGNANAVNVLEAVKEALGRHEAAVVETMAQVQSVAAPQGFLDMQNDFNVQLGGARSQIDGLESQVAALEQQNAALSAQLATARAGMNAATEACIVAEEETPDEEQYCISRSEYDARRARLSGGLLASPSDGGTQ